jgi:MMP 1-O-methyltransferase
MNRRRADSAASERTEEILEVARATPGFMPDDEGEALRLIAQRAGQSFARSAMAPVFVEIGAWCGKSTLLLGAAAQATGALLFSVDHHRGSEEQQFGWSHHDPALVDPLDGRIDTLPHWRRSVARAGLEDRVIGLIGDSPTIAAVWRTPLALCFLDGGHGAEPARADFDGWAGHVAPGGWLAIHDVFEDPDLGGRPPYELWRSALASGQWSEDGACGSLRVLRRLGSDSEMATLGSSG